MQDGATEDVTIKAGIAKLKLNSTNSTNAFEITQDGLDSSIASKTSGGNITFSTIGGGGLSYVSGTTERVKVDSNGNISIGALSSATPSIQLAQGGSITAVGLVTTNSYFRSDRDSSSFCFQGNLAGVQTSLIKSDGSSTFAGSLLVGENPSNGGGAGSRLKNGGGVQACATGGSTNVWAGFIEGTSSTTSAISANGAATFSGYVQSGGQPASGSQVGVRLNANGSVTAGRAVDAERVWSGYKIGTTDATSFITAAGQASFNGTVTAANITAFKTALASSAAAATNLDELKTAITSALGSL